MDRTNSSTSVTSALRKTESYQYPASHLGHLSDSQSRALEEFKIYAAERQYYRPGSSGHGPSHDDETMLRYLRARKFVPADAFQQFKTTEDWRRREKIDELYETIDVAEFDETRRLYPQWTGRRDKRGIPVYVFEVAHLTSKRMSAYEKSISKSAVSGKTSPHLIRLFALYENLLRMVMPLCSSIPGRPYAETPISQSNNIVDIAGVGLKQFWNLRQHMQDASQLATAHYPETLDRIFIIGAPSFFPTVWSWIKSWFDPITVSKIFILSKQNMKSTLEQYMDPADIPRKYGGTLDWEWGSLPSLEPAISNALEWENPTQNERGENGFPPGPVKWRRVDDKLTAIAVGTVNGQKRSTTVAHVSLQQGITIGSLSTQLSRTNTLSRGEDLDTVFGPASTSGVHTHPKEDQEFFPVTGATPPSEHEEEGLESGSELPEEANSKAVQGISNEIRADQKAAMSQPQPEGSAPTRKGTSNTRFAEQNVTLAVGQMNQASPATIDHGYGDKTSTIDPGTVGQAHKNIDILDTKPQSDESSYVSQAKGVMIGVAAAASDLTNTAMSKMGLADPPADNDASIHEQHDQPKAQNLVDTRIDVMEDRDVEEYIRSQYETGNGGKTKVGPGKP